MRSFIVNLFLILELNLKKVKIGMEFVLVFYYFLE